MFLILALLFLFQSDNVPFKEKDEFNVKIDLQFKTRIVREIVGGTTNVPLNETWNEREKKNDAAKFPYLKLRISLLKLSDQEVKAKIVNSAGVTVYNKKVKSGAVVVLDLGFIDQIKDGLKSSEFNLVLSSAEKKKTSRIRILIDKDGVYFINDERYGKF